MKIKTVLFACILAVTAAGCESAAKEAGESDNNASSDYEPADKQASTEGNVIVYDGSQPINLRNPERITVVDFNATWCGPCRAFAPVFADAAAKYAGQADFYSVDVDKFDSLFSMFNQSGIPYIVIIGPDGKIDDHLGSMSAEEFDKMINKALN